MTPQDIESELSYAYLHAVAAAAGAACLQAGRAHDNLGIDAMLTLRKDFGADAPLRDQTVHIQLKATTTAPTARESDGAFSYFLRSIAEYDRLRLQSASTQRVLVVLFLPPDQPDWMSTTAEQLILRRSAYWTSLGGAPACTNSSGCTIYLPAAQQLCVEGLLDLFGRVARFEDLRYAP